MKSVLRGLAALMLLAAFGCAHNSGSTSSSTSSTNTTAKATTTTTATPTPARIASRRRSIPCDGPGGFGLDFPCGRGFGGTERKDTGGPAGSVRPRRYVAWSS